MILVSFLRAELWLAGVWVLCRAAVWLRRGGADWRREALLLLMYVNLAALLRFTFFPLSGVEQPLAIDLTGGGALRVNLRPYVRLSDYFYQRDLMLNVIGNVALFLPGGIILPALYPRLRSFWKTVGTGALLSLGIELVQLLCPSRATDIDDLILNVLGAMIGYGLYALGSGLRRAARKKRG